MPTSDCTGVSTEEEVVTGQLSQHSLKEATEDVSKKDLDDLNGQYSEISDDGTDSDIEEFREAPEAEEAEEYNSQ